MCGIFCTICSANQNPELQYYNIFHEVLNNRGPDAYNTIQCHLLNKTVFMAGYILWQQGSQPVHQPVETSRGILTFNGDIFGGKFKPKENENDTLLLSEILKDALSIPDTIGSIHGPYSFIYFDKIENRIYFGRDRIGRHSLLCARDSDEFTISSVSKNTICSTAEVPALGIFCLDLDNDELFLDPWHHVAPEAETLLREFEKIIGYTININKTKIQITPSVITDIPEFNFDSFIKNISDMHTLYDELLKIDSNRKTVDKLLNLIEKSVKIRVETTRPQCKNCIKNSLEDCEHCRVGVLFSGGLDCSILALISNNFLPENIPIDLLNIAFEKIESNTTSSLKYDKVKESYNGIWNVPDRATGLHSYEELKKLCPNRQWNFVQINVTREELDKCLRDRICHLVFPLKSVLDESLGAALWFAARGEGIVQNDNHQREKYSSPCRVLLMGMGADEMFGGYSRHRAAFRQHGWRGLLDILDSDMRKIPYRNLGRDNRVISDHGVQGRMPYLDEDVVEFTSKLQAYQRCHLDLPLGMGDKLLLRLVARKLGLEKTTTFPKRALQFGSRIADKKQNGSDLSKYLTTE